MSLSTRDSVWCGKNDLTGTGHFHTELKLFTAWPHTVTHYCLSGNKGLINVSSLTLQETALAQP